MRTFILGWLLVIVLSVCKENAVLASEGEHNFGIIPAPNTIKDAGMLSDIQKINLYLSDEMKSSYTDALLKGIKNVTHVNQTPWLNAPRIAWNCPPFTPCPANKIQTLLCLASKGVLLLDLFPFAIRFSTNLRTSLNNNGSTLSFWNDKANPYNLVYRLRNINNLLCNDWDLCLVASCKISCFILSNGFPILVTSTAGLHTTTFYDILIDPTRCVGCNDPLNCNKWKKIPVAQQGPSANLLVYCFGL